MVEVQGYLCMHKQKTMQPVAKTSARKASCLLHECVSGAMAGLPVSLHPPPKRDSDAVAKSTILIAICLLQVSRFVTTTFSRERLR